MKIVFIGAGNVATHLATELYKHSFEIIQVYSRTIESAQSLASQVKSKATNDIKSITTDAGLYIFSVKDSALEEILPHIPKNNGIWVHTAGSVPLDIFSKYHSYYGVIYPFQTFSKKRPVHWLHIPLFIEASDKNTLNTLFTVCQHISTEVAPLSSEQRKYVHLSGVFACNFTNHMYYLAEQTLKKAGISFDVTFPLIDETALKVHTLSPETAQTGPAIRYDKNIIDKHIEMIEDNDIKELYRLISESIHRTQQENKKEN